jgi:hypothetical protein
MKTRKRKQPTDQSPVPVPDVDGAPVPQLAPSLSHETEPLPAPLMMPAVNAAYTLGQWAQSGEGDIDSLIVGLAAQAKALKRGDLTDAERMLMAQASTLDVIFNQLARRAAASMGEYLNAAETYLRLALKAQGQCRATLETLSLVKNPRSVSFVRQANIANGPQQVNNGTAPPTPRPRETENPPIELLE